LSTTKPMKKPRLEAKKKTVQTKLKSAEKPKDVVEIPGSLYDSEEEFEDNGESLADFNDKDHEEDDFVSANEDEEDQAAPEAAPEDENQAVPGVAQGAAPKAAPAPRRST
jgi:hypothetical protein